MTYSLKEKVKEQLAIAEETLATRIIDKIFNYVANEDIDEVIIEQNGQKGEVKFLEFGEVKEKLSLAEKLKVTISQSIKAMAGIAFDNVSNVGRGHFKKESLGKKIVFSVAVYNIDQKEKIIIHVSRNKVKPFSISSLGGERNVLEKIKSTLNQAKGLVFVIGPFNSGKTSTLYSFLSFLNKPELNISTMEDEISYDLPEINQIKIDRRFGVDHSALFSSLLRQDPDVVMIDEIFDREAAEAALNLSLRGYFVLAGVYSQNVFTCLDFLQGLGINLNLLAQAVKLFVNQRLIPKNCHHCLEKEKLTKTSLEKIKKTFGNTFLEKLKNEKIIPSKIKKWEEISFYRGSGCERCHKTGQLGQIGIFEILEMSEVVKNYIKQGHLSAIKNEIKKQENFTLAEEAMAKAVRGLTTIDEVIKLI